MDQFMLPGLSSYGRIIHNTAYDNGNSGTAVTVDLDNGNFQLVTLTDDCTITLKVTTGPANAAATFAVPLMLLVKQDATGGHVVTWAAYGASSYVNWGAGYSGAITATASAEDIALFYGKGTISDVDWYGAMLLSNFS